MEESNTQTVGQTVGKLKSGAAIHELSKEDRSKGGATLTDKRLNALKITGIRKTKCKNCPKDIREFCSHYVNMTDFEKKEAKCVLPILKRRMIEVISYPERLPSTVWLWLCQILNQGSEYNDAKAGVKLAMEYYRTFKPQEIKELHLYQTNIENNKIIAILDKNPDIKEKILEILEKEKMK